MRSTALVALSLVIAAIVVHPQLVRADDDPCLSADYYLDLADTDLHEIEGYEQSGQDDMVNVDKENLTHYFAVADRYAQECQYRDPIAKFALRRGRLAVRSYHDGLLDLPDAADEASRDLQWAFCNEAASSLPDDFVELRSLLKSLRAQQRVPFDPPTKSGC